MSPRVRPAEAGEAAELRYLRSPRAIRERCEALYALALRGELRHWAVDESRLDAIARARGARRRARPTPTCAPSRGTAAGGISRPAASIACARSTNASSASRPPTTTSASPRASISRSPACSSTRGPETGGGTVRGGKTYSRSEGIAVASYDLFVAGAFSNDPARAPLRADADALEGVTAAGLARGLQVDGDNPMVGVEGRAALLQRLGAAVRARPELGGQTRRVRPAASARGPGRSPPGRRPAGRGARSAGIDLAGARGLRRTEPRRRVDARAPPARVPLAQALAVAHVLALRAARAGRADHRRAGRAHRAGRVPQRRPLRRRRRARSEARGRALGRARGLVRRGHRVARAHRSRCSIERPSGCARSWVSRRPSSLSRRCSRAARGAPGRELAAEKRAGRRPAPARAQRWYGLLRTSPWPPTSS